MITPEELKRWREIEKAATPGTWDIQWLKQALRHIHKHCYDAIDWERINIDLLQPDIDDAQFIAESRNAFPRLLDEIERLKQTTLEINEELRKLIKINDKLSTDLVNREAKIAILTEALKFYSVEENHMNQPERGGLCRELTSIDIDKGQIAREALERVKNA